MVFSLASRDALQSQYSGGHIDFHKICPISDYRYRHLEPPATVAIKYSVVEYWKKKKFKSNCYLANW